MYNCIVLRQSKSDCVKDLNSVRNEEMDGGLKWMKKRNTDLQ
jgi:hypothetical protein